MSVPSKPTFDDFKIELRNMDGQVLADIGHTCVKAIRIKIIQGVTTHKLDSATLEIESNSEAATQLDFNALQMISITPYGMPEHSLWGLVMKPKEGYQKRIKRDTITISVVPVEYLLNSRRVFHNNSGEIEGIGISNGKPDDLAKKLVRYCALPGTCTNDLAGNSRDWNWGTLVVANDEGACADTISLTVLKGGLYDVIVGLARKYEFTFELRPSVSGGATTFTFATKYPRGGADRSKTNTDGNTPVLINDIAAAVPSASRWRDWSNMVTAMYAPGFVNVAKDASLETTWGRWEGESEYSEDADLAIELAAHAPVIGSEYEFSAEGLHGECAWLKDWFVGDLVSRNNARLGITEEADRIRALEISFPNRVLQMKITWGDEEKTLSEKVSGGRYRPTPERKIYPHFVTPSITFGTTADAGSAETLIRGDARIQLQFAVYGAGNKATPDPTTGNLLTFKEGSGISMTVSGDHEITIAATAQGMEAHSITGAYHTVTGTEMDLVGLTADNTLGLLTPSSAPGIESAVLKTDANGALTLAGGLNGGANARDNLTLRSTTHATKGYVLVEGALLPATTVTYVLGGSSYRWHTIYGVNGNFSGTVRVDRLEIVADTQYIYSPLAGQVLLAGSQFAGLQAGENGTNKVWLGGGDFYSIGSLQLGSATRRWGKFWGGEASMAGHVYPSANNTYTLGVAGSRWAIVYGVDANISNVCNAAYYRQGGSATEGYYLRGNGTNIVLDTIKGTDLPNSGVGAGNYGSTTRVPQLTVDAKGRITAAANVQLDHGALTGLNDDDHPQYAAIAQSETITGTWTHNANIVMGSGYTVDGVDISAFKAAYDSHVHGLSGHTDTYITTGGTTGYAAIWGSPNGSSGWTSNFTVRGNLGSGEQNIYIAARQVAHYHNLTGGTYGTGAMGTPS